MRTTYPSVKGQAAIFLFFSAACLILPASSACQFVSKSDGSCLPSLKQCNGHDDIIISSTLCGTECPFYQIVQTIRSTEGDTYRVCGECPPGMLVSSNSTCVQECSIDDLKYFDEKNIHIACVQHSLCLLTFIQDSKLICLATCPAGTGPIQDESFNKSCVACPKLYSKALKTCVNTCSQDEIVLGKFCIAIIDCPFLQSSTECIDKCNHIQGVDRSPYWITTITLTDNSTIIKKLCAGTNECQYKNPATQECLLACPTGSSPSSTGDCLCTDQSEIIDGSYCEQTCSKPSEMPFKGACVDCSSLGLIKSFAQQTCVKSCQKTDVIEGDGASTTCLPANSECSLGFFYDVNHANHCTDTCRTTFNRTLPAQIKQKIGNSFHCQNCTNLWETFTSNNIIPINSNQACGSCKEGEIPDITQGTCVDKSLCKGLSFTITVNSTSLQVCSSFCGASQYTVIDMLHPHPLDNLSCIPCPLDRQIVSADGFSCQSTCNDDHFFVETKQVLNNTHNQCRPFSYCRKYVNRQKTACVDTCNQGEIYLQGVGTTRLCLTRPCPSYSYYDFSTGSCLQTCKSVVDKTNNVCFPSPSYCKFFVSGDLSECLLKCDTTYYQDVRVDELTNLPYTVCVRCPSSASYLKFNYTCADSCDTPLPPVLKDGYKECQNCTGLIVPIDGSYTCLGTCSDIEYFEFLYYNNTQTTTASTGVVQCLKRCPTGWVGQISTYKCILPNNCKTTLSYNLQFCVDKCEEFQYQQPSVDGNQYSVCKKTCEFYSFQNSVNNIWVCLPQCPVDMITDELSRTCYYSRKDCPRVISNDGRFCLERCDTSNEEYPRLYANYTQCTFCHSRYFTLPDGQQKCWISCPPQKIYSLSLKKCIAITSCTKKITSKSSVCSDYCILPEVEDVQGNCSLPANYYMQQMRGYPIASFCGNREKQLAIANDGLKCLKSCEGYFEVIGQNICVESCARVFQVSDPNSSTKICFECSQSTIINFSGDTSFCSERRRNVPDLEQNKTAIQEYIKMVTSTNKQLNYFEILLAEQYLSTFIANLIEETTPSTLFDTFQTIIDFSFQLTGRMQSKQPLRLGGMKYGIVSISQREKRGFRFLNNFLPDNFTELIETTVDNFKYSAPQLLDPIDTIDEADGIDFLSTMFLKNPLSNSTELSAVIFVHPVPENKHQLFSATFQIPRMIDPRAYVCATFQQDGSIRLNLTATRILDDDRLISCDFTDNAFLYLDRKCQVITEEICQIIYRMTKLRKASLQGGSLVALSIGIVSLFSIVVFFIYKMKMKKIQGNNINQISIQHPSISMIPLKEEEGIPTL